MLRRIEMQFRKPSGFLGMLISFLMIKGNRISYENVIKDLEILTNDKILEIGYGPGFGINLISKKYEKCDIYGIDFSELMYMRASRLNKQFIENERVHLLFGDLVETKISTSGFDKIFCVNVVYFWDNLQKPFERIKSLLKDNGIFCFYMANKEDLPGLKSAKDEIFNKYSIGQILDALKSAGFSEVNYYYKKGFYIKVKNNAAQE